MTAGLVRVRAPGSGPDTGNEPARRGRGTGNGRDSRNGPAGGRPLLRLLWLAGPLRGRLALSVLAGAAATGFGVALLATSGFMLARASEHPGILAISVAVVAVRAFSVGRGVSRYLERLTSHDVAFRVLADIRVAIYRRLERLAPAGWPAPGQTPAPRLAHAYGGAGHVVTAATVARPVPADATSVPWSRLRARPPAPPDQPRPWLIRMTVRSASSVSRAEATSRAPAGSR